MKTKKWTIMCYTFSDNKLEQCTFKDLAKMTFINQSHKDTTACMLLDTKSMGSYHVVIDGNPYMENGIRMKRCKKMVMSNLANLANFITKSVKDHPAEHYILILGGHGSGWYLKMEDTKCGQFSNLVSTHTIADCLKKTGVKLDILCFDNCLMGVLETVAEFEGLVDYITACQDYCPDAGVINKNIFNEFKSNDVRQIGLNIIKGFIDGNNDPEADPCDIVLYNVKMVGELVKFVRELKLSSDDFVRLSRRVNSAKDNLLQVDLSWPHLQDLYSVIELKHKFVEINDTDFVQFVVLFGGVVVCYQQNITKNNTYHHGLSVVVFGEKLDGEEHGLYDKLRNKCVNP